MALSNIFKEPRREITETAVGAAIVGPLIYADYLFACWFESIQRRPDDSFYILIGLALGALGLFGIAFGMFALHDLGETICNRLQEAGIRLRPRQRR